MKRKTPEQILNARLALALINHLHDQPDLYLHREKKRDRSGANYVVGIALIAIVGCVVYFI